MEGEIEGARVLIVAAVMVVGVGAIVALGIGAVRAAELGVDYLRTRARSGACFRARDHVRGDARFSPQHAKAVVPARSVVSAPRSPARVEGQTSFPDHEVLS